MATRRPARLYQKKTGVFFIRVLLPASKTGTKKRELRRSLRTRSLVEARSISSYVNALLERTPNEERAAVINNLLPHAVSTWTLPGGISAEDDDDQRRLLDFMAQRPEIARAIVEQMQARTRYLNSLADRTAAQAPGSLAPTNAPQILMPPAFAASPAPQVTMRMSGAVKAYRYRYAERFDKHSHRPLCRNLLLEQLVAGRGDLEFVVESGLHFVVNDAQEPCDIAGRASGGRSGSIALLRSAVGGAAVAHGAVVFEHPPIEPIAADRGASHPCAVEPVLVEDGGRDFSLLQVRFGVDLATNEKCLLGDLTECHRDDFAAPGFFTCSSTIWAQVINRP